MDEKQKKMQTAIAKDFEEIDCKPQYTAKKPEEVMVSMSDGKKMQTFIIAPEGDGPWPTLIVRTPYPMIEAYYKEIGKHYAERGFVYVFQFCRGTNKSEGEWEPNVNERNDGIDTVNWLADKSWCKNIGIHGVSYMALTGWIIADSLPDKVKGMYLCHYGVDRHLSAYKDGLFRHDILTGWAMGNAGKKLTDNFEEDYIKTALYRPHADVFEKLWGIDLPWYRQWVTNTDYECEYWQTGIWQTLKEIPPKINIPVCIVAGWFDHHLEGTILGYNMLNESVKEKSQLVVGAWNHDFAPSIPGHKSDNAKLNMQKLMFKWFHGLLGENETTSGSIMTYVPGKDKWRNWNEWPVKNVENLNFYFSGEKYADEKACALSTEEPSEESYISFTYDPENPVYSVGGETIFVTQDQRGSRLQEKAGYRDDVISFVSPEFEEDINIAGSIKVVLDVSSDCADTAFTAKISEVLTDGSAYNIRSTITTLAYRNGAKTRQEYSPEEKVEIELNMLPVTWSINKGSKIRVDISSSNFPEYAIHSNTEGIWSLQGEMKKAKQTLYFGGKNNARVIIQQGK